MPVTNKILKLHQPKPRYQVIQEIAKRWSPRYYSAEPVKGEHLKSIFEAVLWAPSGHNYQPWYFYYARQGSEAYRKLFSTLNEYNQSWAKTAPLLILGCVSEKSEEGENPFAVYDLGAAVISLILQAQALGYYARQMGLFDQEKAREFFKLKKEYRPFIVIALGKIGDYQTAPKEIIEYELDPRPRKEKIAEEL